MTKMVDIERFKNKYFHRVGTQFDNAIFVAENEFLINAYTKADIVSILDKIRSEIAEEAKCTIDVNRAGGLYKALQIIDKYKAESEE